MSADRPPQLAAEPAERFALTPFRAVLWTVATTTLLRLLYFVEHLASPFATVPILDSRYYDSVARALANGQALEPFSASFRSLAYPALLAMLYRASADWGMVLATAVQHLAGIVTAALVALLGGRLTGRPSAGLAAGLLYALAGPPLYFEGELLTTSLFTLLLTCHLLLASRIDPWDKATPAGWRRWLLAGACGGLAAVLRPTLLPILAAYPILAWPGDPARRWRRLAASGAGLGAAFLLLALGGILQRPWVGHWQLLPTASGINFYLGNKATADGRTPRQDRAVTYAADYRDSVEAFAEQGYRQAQRLAPTAVADPRQVSRYWRHRGEQEIAAKPQRWLGLMARKAAYWTWNREISNNKSYAFVAGQESPLLRRLPVRWWLLLALAPLGAAWAWRRGQHGRLLWLLAQLACYGLGVSLFFVNARYRLPLWPPMAVLAGGGVVALWQSISERRWRRLAMMVSLAAAIATLSLANLPSAEPPSQARDFFFRSIAHYQRGAITEALADARRSLDLEADEPAVLLQLATAQLAAEQPREALAALDRAALGRAEEPRIHNLRGIALERLGQHRAGYTSYLEALRLLPDYPPALINATLLELRAGWWQRAAEHLRAARASGLDSVRTRVAAAVLAHHDGNLRQQRQFLNEARHASSTATQELLAELSQRLAWGAPDELSAGSPQQPAHGF